MVLKVKDKEWLTIAEVIPAGGRNITEWISFGNPTSLSRTAACAIVYVVVSAVGYAFVT